MACQGFEKHHHSKDEEEPLLHEEFHSHHHSSSRKDKSKWFCVGLTLGILLALLAYVIIGTLTTETIPSEMEGPIFYLILHGQESNGKLSVQGLQRANYLATYFSTFMTGVPTHLFTVGDRYNDDSSLAHQTLEPLSNRLHLPIQIWRREILPSLDASARVIISGEDGSGLHSVAKQLESKFPLASTYQNIWVIRPGGSLTIVEEGFTVRG